MDISILIGETLTEVRNMTPDSDEVLFVTARGKTYRMYHEQNCCEGVRLNDVTGNPADLIGAPILKAESTSNSDDDPPEHADSWTWTFYTLATIKGYVTLRWLGESNGYYSESVDFAEVA